MVVNEQNEAIRRGRLPATDYFECVFLRYNFLFIVRYNRSFKPYNLSDNDQITFFSVQHFPQPTILRNISQTNENNMDVVVSWFLFVFIFLIVWLIGWLFVRFIHLKIQHRVWNARNVLICCVSCSLVFFSWCRYLSCFLFHATKYTKKHTKMK